MVPTSSAPPSAPPDGAALFSPDYATARLRFREAATVAGATLSALELTARGPGGETLTLDIARLGAAHAPKVLLHVCGLHGVEAFTGSAVQLALLGAPPAMAPDTALVLVHVANPWGMAWLRRCNDNNVDLNRNFLAEDASWSGCPPLYNTLDPLLNPPSPPSRDFFLLRLAGCGLRHGSAAVRQAIAHGQYRYPRGLFYGGDRLQAEARLLGDWLHTALAAASHVFAIDLHTGLGRRGDSTLIAEPLPGNDAAALSRRLGLRVQGGAGSPAAYAVRGSFGAALPRLLPGARIGFVLQEIGTAPPLQVLHALREENRWHHHGDGGDHPCRRALLSALCPADRNWRETAVSHGSHLAQRAAIALQSGTD